MDCVDFRFDMSTGVKEKFKKKRKGQSKLTTFDFNGT